MFLARIPTNHEKTKVTEILNRYWLLLADELFYEMFEKHQKYG